MSAHRVAAVGEISEGERKLVQVEGTSIGLFNLDGEVHALRNECLHQGGPVCTGRVGGKLVAEHPAPGERTRERISDQAVLACPWHGWEYDVETGEHLGNSEKALETYEVEETDDGIYVHL